MKTVISAFLITAVLGVQAYPGCAYFRTSAELLKCAAADAEKVKADDPYAARPDELELDGPAAALYVRVDCECRYSLTGSNVLCDVDQTIERSSVIGAEKPAEACLRGRSLCKDVCPQHLP